MAEYHELGIGERHVAHPDAQFVIFGHLLVQPAAISAIHVGEDEQLVFGLVGQKVQRVPFVQARQQFAAHFGAARLGQVLAVGHVLQIARAKEPELPARIDIGNPISEP